MGFISLLSSLVVLDYFGSQGLWDFLMLDVNSKQTQLLREYTDFE